MERGVYSHYRPFKLESGEVLDNLEVCYHISEGCSKGKKVIWICHALTADSNPSQWWKGIVGKGKLLDTDTYCIICANILGSCYGSSGPAKEDSTGRAPMLKFPLVTVRDTVNAHNLLRLYIGIDKIDLMIGGSIGGFQALEWSIMYPDIVERLLLIACSAKVSPWATAFNEAQRMAIESDPLFREQIHPSCPKRGLEAARAVALLSYRSYQGYAITQGEESNSPLYATKACSYQRYQGEKLSSRFDAYSYFYLTKCIDSHNCARGRENLDHALSGVKADTVICGIEGDLLFPQEEQLILSKKIKGAKFEKLYSKFGHDGFLLEYEQTERVLLKSFHNFFNINQEI